MWCVAVKDAHRVFGASSVGGWKADVPNSTDNPDKIDLTVVIINSKAGHVMITNGPFLNVETGMECPSGPV